MASLPVTYIIPSPRWIVKCETEEYSVAISPVSGYSGVSKQFWSRVREPAFERGNMSERLKNQDQVKKFWEKKEELLGGKVIFQTYVTYIGDAGTAEYNGRGGLFYIVNDRLYFEDFEKFNALMALFNRKDDAYEKTEFSIPLEDITMMYRVTEKDAKACIDGEIEDDKVPEMSKFKSFFNRGYWKIVSKGRRTMFMEIMEEEALMKHLPNLQQAR